MLTYTRTYDALRSLGLQVERNGKWSLVVRHPDKPRRKLHLDPIKVVAYRGAKPCAFFSAEQLTQATAL